MLKVFRRNVNILATLKMTRNSNDKKKKSETKETIHKHCSLASKVISYTSMSNNFVTVVHKYWNSSNKYLLDVGSHICIHINVCVCFAYGLKM